MYPKVVTKVNERISMVFSGATGTYGQTIPHPCLLRLLKKKAPGEVQRQNSGSTLALALSSVREPCRGVCFLTQGKRRCG